MDILFVGYVMLGRLVNEDLKSKPPDHPWGDTLPIFEKADCRLSSKVDRHGDRTAATNWPSLTRITHAPGNTRYTASPKE